MIDTETRQQFEDEVYLICGDDKKTASRIMIAFDTLRGKYGIMITEEQLKHIKNEFWNESGEVLGDDMIEIHEAYGIVLHCIGYKGGLK
nr:MAG TPA: hypothetical protein [Caudoviricetes sp.]